jgi:hypothetical protein
MDISSTLSLIDLLLGRCQSIVQVYVDVLELLLQVLQYRLNSISDDNELMHEHDLYGEHGGAFVSIFLLDGPKIEDLK